MKKKTKGKSKFREKLEMYDMILANIAAGKAIIEPSEKMNNSQIHIGFNCIASESQLTKYYILNKFPDYVEEGLMHKIRNRCTRSGVRINFYFYGQPYFIDWDSPEMRNKMRVWSEFATQQSSNTSVFKYRDDKKAIEARERIIKSTRYLNEAELDYKRSLVQTYFILEVTAKRDDLSIYNMGEAINDIKLMLSSSGIGIKECRVNMLDWVRSICPFSLDTSKEVSGKISKKVLTDDILANMHGYSQGWIGESGIPLGLDIDSLKAVLRVFKEDPNAPENWLVVGETGSGKSLFIKQLLPYFLAIGYRVAIMDYEGDEYTNFGNFVRAGNSDDIKIISMGKTSSVYFDPCPIADLTGDMDIDVTLKQNAIQFITATIRIMAKGTDGELNREESKVLSTAIDAMYSSVLVSDDMSTWKNSKVLTLHDLYYELNEIVIQKRFVDDEDGNRKHKAAVSLRDSLSIFFEPDGMYYSMFRKPMSANELYKAQLVIFSFGMRGASDSTSDPILLALRQLSVAYVNIQISNYCKYVLHTFNVKIWEEFQRWGNAKGSAEIINNTITGGRKRGDINFIATNDLAALLDENNNLSSTLMGNIQNYIVGKIVKKSVIDDFCEQFNLNDVKRSLYMISKANRKKNKVTKRKKATSNTHNRYKHAFMLALEDGTTTIVKAMLPDNILDSDLYTTGVVIK